MRRREISRPGAAIALFGVALAASFAVLVVFTTNVTFFLDDWELLLHRRGLSPGVILEPNNEHPAMVPIVIYKLLLAAFGMESARPFQIVALLTFVVAAALLFVWLRRRVGDWLAFAGMLPLLFLGASYEDLLWQFQVGYFGSTACGVGALLALERDDDPGDRLACALLVGGLAFSSLGLPFVSAAAVWLAWDSRRLRRAYVAVVPALLYVLWWLGWGHHADNALSLRSVATSPSYVLDGFGSSLGSLLGLGTERPDTELTSIEWGRPLLLAAIAAAVWVSARAGRPSRRLATVVALGLTFWFLAAVNAGAFRDPATGRYQYVGAVILLMIVGALLQGVRAGRLAVGVCLGIAVIATASNLLALDRGRARLAALAEIERGGLAAFEAARDTVDPDFRLNPENSNAFYADLIDPASYFSAVDAFGSPAYSLDELASAAEGGRVAADLVSAAALRVRLKPAPADARHLGCVDVAPADPAAPATVALGGQAALIYASRRARARIGLRRYAAASFPVDLGTSRGDGVSSLRIPPDRSRQPWELSVASEKTVRVCASP